MEILPEISYLWTKKSHYLDADFGSALMDVMSTLSKCSCVICSHFRGKNVINYCKGLRVSVLSGCRFGFIY